MQRVLLCLLGLVRLPEVAAFAPITAPIRRPCTLPVRRSLHHDDYYATTIRRGRCWNRNMVSTSINNDSSSSTPTSALIWDDTQQIQQHQQQQLMFANSTVAFALDDVGLQLDQVFPVTSSLDPFERNDVLLDSSALMPPPPPPPTSSLSLWQGRLIVIGAAAIYGTNFACIKLLDGVMPLAASAAVRFCMAAIAITGAVLWQERRSDASDDMKHRGNLEPWWLGAEVGAWYCVGYLSQAPGLHTVEASKSAFFNTLAVIVVPLLDVLFKQKKLGWTGVTSVVTALAGVALLEMGPHSATQTASDAITALSSSLPLPSLSTLSSSLSPSSWLQEGDLFCFAQALFFGIGYWRLETASTKYPNESGPITAGQLLAIAAGSLAYWFGSTANLPTMTQMMAWLTDPFILSALAWTGLVATAFALWLETVALSVVSATELTILMTSVSLWGSLFAYLFMGETMTKLGMVGGAMILSGCLLTGLSKTVEDE